MSSTATRAADLLALARKFDRRICKLVRRSCQTEAYVGSLLSAMERLGLPRALGFKSLNAYARHVADWSGTKTSRIVTLIRDLKSLPKLERAFFSGEIPWTKACVAGAAAAADPEQEDVWLERVQTLSRDELESVARKEAGLPEEYEVVLKLSAEQHAWLQDAVVKARREANAPVDRNAAVAEACRRMAQGVPGVGGTASGRPIVAIGVCADCDTATHGAETRSAGKEPALCQAQIVDFTTEPPTLRPSIPPRVASQVLARDQARCRVPGCDNRTWIQLHHEGGWRNIGHDPERIVTLCSTHHGARHDELLKLSFESGRVTFSLADGEVLGDVDLRILAPARRDARVARAQQAASASGANVANAGLALGAVGIDANEVARLTDKPGPCASTKLVKETMERRPVSA